MNQLNLNLELGDKLEEQEYRGYVIVLQESIPKRIVDRCQSVKDFYGQYRSQWMTITETRTYWQSTIYGDKYSGQSIVGDAFNKQEALLRTQSWIDIHIFGEKEKHRYQR